MTAVTIDDDEHDRTDADDAAVVTAELPIVSDAELAPPFPAVVAAPAVAAPAAEEPTADPAVEDAAVDAPVVGPPASTSPSAPSAPRIIVIGDADADAATGSAPSTARVALPSVTPGPAVLKHSGALVFGDAGGVRPKAPSGAGGAASIGVDDPTAASPDRPDGSAGSSAPRVVVIGDVDETPPDVEIDPRIKARRTQVKRSAGLRRLRAAAVIVVAFVLVFGGGTVLRSYVLVVRSVVVTGTAYTPREAIQEVVNTVAGRSMVDVSLVDVRKQLERSPWVKAVDVTRDWPSTIRIDVLERRPVAYYRGQDDHGYVVDESGLVLVLTDGQPADYLEITGALDPVEPGSLAPDPVRAGAKVANALPSSLRAVVAAIDSKPTGVVLKLTGSKSQILLGGAEDLAAKLVTVLAFQETCPPGSYDTLDVRVPGKPAVTPAAGCKAKGKGP